ncbi:MAG: hypothetical protein HRT45_09730 [Bdellovibrionales bacterium]|nr:hypothetical protein [Bdellovibrionales bacterium]
MRIMIAIFVLAGLLAPAASQAMAGTPRRPLTSCLESIFVAADSRREARLEQGLGNQVRMRFSNHPGFMSADLELHITPKVSFLNANEIKNYERWGEFPKVEIYFLNELEDGQYDTLYFFGTFDPENGTKLIPGDTKTTDAAPTSLEMPTDQFLAEIVHGLNADILKQIEESKSKLDMFHEDDIVSYEPGSSYIKGPSRVGHRFYNTERSFDALINIQAGCGNLGLEGLNAAIEEMQTTVEATAPSELNPKLNLLGYDLLSGALQGEPQE